MGKTDDVLHRYLEDEERFADLFNGALFGGEQVIDAKEIAEASEQYKEAVDGNSAGTGKTEKDLVARHRDLKKYMKGGGVLRILALENQNLVDYAMPIRCMEYDTLEYCKQLRMLKKKNESVKDYINGAERLCKVKKEDRLKPAYTLCLYHGEEPWDGPRTLKDMMEFEDADVFEQYFSDYPMRLYCVNEKNDLSVFHTELKELFMVMQYRKNKTKMKNALEKNEAYRHLSEETVEAISVVMNEPSIWRNREMYKNDGEKEENYDMCQALREWAEDERNEGRAEGKAEAILYLLEEKGEITREFRNRITGEADAAILKKWILVAAKAESVEAFKKDM